MLTKTIMLSAVVFACFCGPQAFAATAAHDDPPGCFDVIPISPQALKTGSILVNRCSGDTWLLMPDPVKSHGHTVYSWHPIPRASGEATAASAGDKTASHH
jgi:hypothetical protein